MERYDIAIIGTGPAGLSAAITSKVRNKRIILFGDKDLSPKVVKAHSIANYLGLPDVSGEDLGNVFKNHIEKMGIEITQDKINSIFSMGDYYALQGGENAVYEATSVILATGIVTGKAIPGEDENLGRGVSYCATCDAALYKGKSAIVLGYSPKEEEEAEFLAEIADTVYYLPQYKEEAKLSGKVRIVQGKPQSIERNAETAMMKVVTDQGELEANGVFVLREAIQPKQLVPGLITEGSHVVVDINMKTNLPGCFACGDIAGTPYQYIKSAGQGNIAALSAVSYLAEVKNK